MDEEYKKTIIENQQGIKSAHKRIDKIENEIKAIKELTIAVEKIAMETKATREDVNDMSGRLKIVEEKPARSWENIKSLIITRNSNSYSGLFFSKIRFIGGMNYEE